MALAYAARHGGLVGAFGKGWQHLGALYGNQARNYLRYGPIATCFAGVVNAECAPPSEWVWYLHHPPALGWTMAACFAALGVCAFSAKVTGVIAALAQVIITYHFVARALSRRAGLAAAFTTAVVPAGAYFSTHGSELGPQAIALVLLALLLDSRARELDPRHPRVTGTAAALAAAALYSWVALPAAATIAVQDALARRWRRVAAIATTAALPFALLFAQTWWITRHRSGAVFGGDLLSAFANRSVGDASWWAAIAPGRVASRFLSHLRFDFTPVGIALALAGALLLVLPRRSATATLAPLRLERAVPPVITLLVLALGYTLPFAQGVLMHRYWLLVALPLVSLLIGTATHVLAAHRTGAWIMSALLAAMAWEGISATLRWQARDATPWYEEVGRVVRNLVPKRALLATLESSSCVLEFYAERRVLANVGDADLPATPEALVAGLSPDVPWFVLTLPPIDAPSVKWQRIPAWLESNAYEATRQHFPGCAQELRLYDLSRRPDGSAYELR